jgi:hypothetical protein
MTATTWSHYIYKTADGREMLAMSPTEALTLNIALIQGRISYEEVAQIRGETPRSKRETTTRVPRSTKREITSLSEFLTTRELNGEKV